MASRSSLGEIKVSTGVQNAHRLGLFDGR